MDLPSDSSPMGGHGRKRSRESGTRLPDLKETLLNDGIQEKTRRKTGPDLISNQPI